MGVSGGRPAVIDGYASANVVACSQASVLFRVSRLRDGDVALKVFQLGGTPAEQAFARTRMLGDWRIWSELAHRHVLPVQDFGDRSGSLYLATPWVNGPSLRAVLDQRRRLDPAHVRQLATQIASALDSAAAVRLIHLDIKPENVLFASAEDVVHSYVTDFGAGSLAAREVGADPSRSFRGTYEYAAPEQVQRGSIDRRAMVYSLGCLVYETLTGATPYGGRPRDLAPPPVADAPPEVGLVLAKALAYRREERYATCAEFAEALGEALAFAQPPDPVRATRRRRSVGLRHLTVAASVALVACCAATAASWLTQSGPGGSHPAPLNTLPSHDFYAALPAATPTVVTPRKPVLRAAAATKTVPAQKARTHAPASLSRHDRSAATSRPQATSVAAHIPTTAKVAAASSSVARQASAPATSSGSAGESSAAATTTPVAVAPPSPPPPPPATSDPTPPLPPPPP
jgi:serine/threonine-protein kinase